MHRQLGTDIILEDLLVQVVAGWAFPHQVPNLVCPGYPTKSIQLLQLGKVESPPCPFHLRRGTPEHILSWCPKVLGESHYWWSITIYWRQLLTPSNSNSCRCLWLARQAVAFIRAGEKPQPSLAGLFGPAHDWQMRVDPGEAALILRNHTETRHSADFRNINACGHSGAEGGRRKEVSQVCRLWRLFWRGVLRSKDKYGIMDQNFRFPDICIKMC